MTSSITRKAAVAHYLLENSGEWFDSSVLTEIGGAAGDRRLRELRAAGWNIKVRRSPEAATKFQYRLVRPPAKKIQRQVVGA